MEPDIRRIDDLLVLNLQYPRAPGAVTTIEIGLCEVRAADSIRVSYDFARDGWLIQQASTFEWAADDPRCDGDWQEVTFVHAWGRKKGGA